MIVPPAVGDTGGKTELVRRNGKGCGENSRGHQLRRAVVYADMSKVVTGQRVGPLALKAVSI
jgi:hypothetical protein